MANQDDVNNLLEVARSIYNDLLEKANNETATDKEKELIISWERLTGDGPADAAPVLAEFADAVVPFYDTPEDSDLDYAKILFWVTSAIAVSEGIEISEGSAQEIRENVSQIINNAESMESIRRELEGQTSLINELSYFLWLSGPDDVYTSAAEAKQELEKASLIVYAAALGLEIKDFQELLESDGAGGAIRRAYQCYLLYNMENIAQAHRTLLWNGRLNTSYRDSSGMCAVPTSPNLIQTVGYIKKNKPAEPRIILVNDSNSNESLPLMNKIYMCKDSDKFLNISNADYAQLIPKLKIYKVYRSPDDQGTPKIIEMKFDNFTTIDGIAKQLTAAITPGGGTSSIYSKGTASGIKSFKWSFQGTDPYTATRDIDATLTLTLQHFSELTKDRGGYKYLDLIIQPDCTKAKNNNNSPGEEPYPVETNNIYKAECYEIRIDVGYYGPDNYEEKYGLCCQTESLFLTLTNHSFNFKKDGTLEVTINYKGRLETLMRDRKFNVLLPGGGFADVKFQDPYDTSQTPKFIGIKEVENKIIEENKKEEDPSKEQALKELKGQKDYFYANYKKFFFNNLMTRLYNKGFIHRYVLPTKEMLAFLLLGKVKPGDLGKINLIRPSTDDFLKNGISEGNLGMVVMDAEVKKAVSASADAAPDVSLLTDDDEGTDPVLKQVKDENYLVNYIFLGDLLSLITSSVLGEYFDSDAFKQTSGDNQFVVSFEPPDDSGANTQELQTIQSLLDNFQIILDNLTVKFNDNDYTTTINLAHLPISINTFEDFWRRNVISKDIDFYSYFGFISDLLKELMRFLSTDCFGGIIEGKIRPFTGMVNSQQKIENGRLSRLYVEFENGEQCLPPQLTYLTLDLQKVTLSDPLLNRCDKSPTEPFTYFAVSAQQTIPSNLNGNVAEDHKNGIFHFRYGLTSGLLIDANFNKTDQEYLAEGRYLNEGNLVFNQLANVYDAQFNMLGNTLFRPGQYICFNPQDVGMGQPWEYSNSDRSWSNVMGLGGYHIVTKTESEISRGVYKTTVRARWETGGKQ